MKFRTFLQTDSLTDYKKAYLCRLKLLYMNFKSSTLATICTNLLFCLSVISFFGANTTLRLPAVGALYKEYLTGCIALVLFYFQKKHSTRSFAIGFFLDIFGYTCLLP